MAEFIEKGLKNDTHSSSLPETVALLLDERPEPGRILATNAHEIDRLVYLLRNSLHPSNELLTGLEPRLPRPRQTDSLLDM